jgi:prepilin peptidase CpaA
VGSITPIGPALAATLVALVLIAAITDWRSRLIPNWLTVAALASALAIHIATGSWGGLRTSLSGFLVGFVVYLPFLLLRGMGAGDLKLMAAIGSIVGPTNCILVFVLTSLAGGVIAIAVLLSRGRLAETLSNTAWILSELAHGRKPHEQRPELALGSPKAVPLPYAIPIALGALGYLVASGSLSR